MYAAQTQLGRVINPTFYTPEGFTQRALEGQSFILPVLAHPELFVKEAHHNVISVGGVGESGSHRQADKRAAGR